MKARDPRGAIPPSLTGAQIQGAIDAATADTAPAAKKGLWSLIGKVFGESTSIKTLAGRATPWAFGAVTVYQVGSLIFHSQTPPAPSGAPLPAYGLSFLDPGALQAWDACGDFVGGTDHGPLVVAAWYSGGCSTRKAIGAPLLRVKGGTLTTTDGTPCGVGCGTCADLAPPQSFTEYRVLAAANALVCGFAESSADYVSFATTIDALFPDVPHPPAAGESTTGALVLTPPSVPADPAPANGAESFMADPNSERVLDDVIRGAIAAPATPPGVQGLPGETGPVTRPPAIPGSVALPAIQPDELYVDYAARLSALGFQPARADVPESNYYFSPDVALSVPPRALPNSQVPVQTNPAGTDDDTTSDRCRRTSSQVDSNTTTDPYTVKDSFTAINLPDVPLRWGRYTVGAKRGNFGYRKIIAKHGWGTLDRADTVSALTHPSVPPTQETDGSGTPTTTWRFYYFYKLKGVPCTRKVVVQTRTVASDNRPMGIITSFAYEGQILR